MELRKKHLIIISLLLSLCLLLGMSGTAFAAFEDLDENSNEYLDVMRLVGLGVLEGYPDGTFRASENITRAEFAKIATYLADKEHAANSLKTMQPSFPDVKVNEWYTGYINLAASLGYVKGDPDGSFRPNDKITNAEVITVLLRVLGYDDRLVGTWPANYLSKAAELGIIDRMAGMNASAPATRGDVAIMGSEVLDEYWVEYDRNSGLFVSPVDPSSKRYLKLLERNFRGQVKEDVLITGWEISGNSKKITYWDRDGYNDNKENDWKIEDSYRVLKTVSLKDDVVYSGGKDINYFGDWIADIYISSDDNKVTFIEKKNYPRIDFIERNNIPESHLVQAELLNNGRSIKVDGSSYTLDGNAYIAAGGSYEAAFAKDFLKSDKNEKTYEGELNGVTQMLAAERIRLTFDENGNVIQVKLTNWGTPGLVKSVDLKRERIVAKSGANGQPTFPTDLNEKTYVVESTRLGVLQVNDLSGAMEEGDVVYIYDNAYGKDYYILVYGGRQVSGTLSSAEFTGEDDQVWRITVDGKKYDMKPGRTRISKDDGETFMSLSKEEIRNLYGRKVTLYLAGSGDVEFLESDVETSGASKDFTGTMYGVLEKLTFSYAGAEARMDGIASMKIVRADGREIYYNTGGTSYVHYQDEDGNWVTFDPTDATDNPKAEEDFEHTAALLGLVKNADGTVQPWDPDKGKLARGVLLEFDLRDDGTLGNITPLVNSDYSGKLTDVDTDLNRVKIDGVWYSIQSYTTIYDNLDPNNVDVIEWANVKYDLRENLGNGVTAYFKRTSNKIEYLAIPAPAGVTDRFGALVAAGRDVTGYYADLDIGGTVVRYDAGAVKNMSSYINSATRSVIRYTLSGGDLDTFHEIGDNNPYSVAGSVYYAGDGKTYKLNGFAYVKRLDASAQALEIEITAKADDGTTKKFSKWYSYDKDTKVWDIDDQKDKVTFEDTDFIADGDRILLALPTGGFTSSVSNITDFEKAVFRGFDEESVKNGNVLKWLGIRN